MKKENELNQNDLEQVIGGAVVITVTGTEKNPDDTTTIDSSLSDATTDHGGVVRR